MTLELLPSGVLMLDTRIVGRIVQARPLEMGGGEGRWRVSLTADMPRSAQRLNGARFASPGEALRALREALPKEGRLHRT